MKKETAITGYSPAEVRRDDGIARDRFTPYLRLHRLLRGRYGKVLVACGVLGPIFAAIGYLSAEPLYRSEGLLQLEYRLPVVVEHTADNDPMDTFREYLRSQVLLIKSRQIVKAAMQDEEYLQVKRRKSDKPKPAASESSDRDKSKSSSPRVESFAGGLDVEHPLSTQTIRIAYTHEDAEIAAAAVGAVIRAYLSEHARREDAADEGRLAALRQRQDQLNEQIDGYMSQLAAEDSPVSPDAIAMVDDLMRDYMRQRSNLEANIRLLYAGGRGQNHPQVISANRALDFISEKIERYAEEFRTVQLATAGAASSDQHAITVLPQFEPYRRQLNDLREELLGVERRIRVLEIQDVVGDQRIKVLTAGDVPTSPASDRRKMLGLLGGMFGFALPLGVATVLGMADRRYRFADDVEPDENPPVLGILPTLPERFFDVERANLAAHELHHIRLVLQMGADTGPRAYMVTSAASGDGKTSLTWALGMSFANSGSRTLLIDGDMIGRGMSRRLGVDHQPGLAESLAEGRLNGHVVETDKPDLSVLPVGATDDARACTVSPERIRRLIDQARSQFDVVLVDTGPIFGSLEAEATAQACDGVVFTISRGQHRPLVRKALGQLRDYGAKVVGVVFNHATLEDFRRSAYSTSVRSHGATRDPALADAGTSAFGPVESSLASSMPQSRE